MKYKDAERIAKVYNEFGEYYHNSRTTGFGRIANEYIEMPATLSLIPTNLEGKLVLDAGCGTGIYSRILAKRNAKIKAIDISKNMIDIAKTNTPSSYDIEYKVGNIYELPYKDCTFDIVLCAFVLENIENIHLIFKELSRVLKNNGDIICSVTHPVKSHCMTDNYDKDGIAIINDYFSKGMFYANFGDGMIVPKYLRNLNDYIFSARENNLCLTDLLEPKPIAKARYVDKRKYSITRKIPQVLIMKFNLLIKQP